MALIVNASVEGGFFAFLGQLKLSVDKRFDLEAEMKQQNTTAIVSLMEQAKTAVAIEEANAQAIIARQATHGKLSQPDKEPQPETLVEGAEKLLRAAEKPQAAGGPSQPPPKEIWQTIWDTGDNVASTQADIKFNPFNIDSVSKHTLGGAVFTVFHASIDDGESIDRETLARFGAGARVAPFEELKRAAANLSERHFKTFLDNSGLHSGSPRVTYDGRHTSDRKRGPEARKYFIARFDGNRPSSWLAHDTIYQDT
eukprot:7179841-Prymnesium_polylepis.1